MKFLLLLHEEEPEASHVCVGGVYFYATFPLIYFSEMLCCEES